MDLYTLRENLNQSKLVPDCDIDLRARLESSRNKGKLCFLILRDNSNTIQAVLHKSSISAKDFKLACHCQLESVVRVRGKLVNSRQEIKSCTFKKLEIQCTNFEIINEAEPSGIQINCNFIHSNSETAHEMRVLDMRNNENQLIMSIKSKISRYCQMYLWENNFTQIQTPKLISTASEGGASVFKLADYFGKEAFLAQSPQFFKQMAINSELPRVYEIGPVFRAENSNSIRHTTEFTGVDMEMRIEKDYHEVINHLWNMVTHVLKQLVQNDIDSIKRINPDFNMLFHEEPLIIDYVDGIKMLQEDGDTIILEENLSGSQEKRLGDLVKQKYHSDIFVLDKFPIKLRPFYTQPHDETYSKGYDIIIRGMEVLSGAQRIHDPELLLKRASEEGVDIEKIKHYVDSFKWGSYPHGGGGFGLERLVMNILGLDNIRKASIFYRDPRRLEP